MHFYFAHAAVFNVEALFVAIVCCFMLLSRFVVGFRITLRFTWFMVGCFDWVYVDEGFLICSYAVTVRCPMLLQKEAKVGLQDCLWDCLNLLLIHTCSVTKHRLHCYLYCRKCYRVSGMGLLSFRFKHP